MNIPLHHNGTIEPVQLGPVALTLHIENSLAAVEQTWLELEQTGIATVYQSFTWCDTWVKSFASALHITPCIVVAENALGDVQFILPLQYRRSKGVRIIEILTSPQTGYGFGVFHEAFLQREAFKWFAEQFEHLVSILPPHDVLCLAPLPHMMFKAANPLLAVQHFRIANQSHIMDLRKDFTTLFAAKRSAETRRSIRKRDHKLATAGKLHFELPTSPQDFQDTLSTMFKDQQSRLAEAGVHHIFTPNEQNFIAALGGLQTTEGAFLRPYRLMLDGKILAVMLGAYFKNTYWALISSMADSPVSKHSPGDFALRAMIEALCKDGTQQLDFSAGDSDYKMHWADQQLSLHMVLRANTLRGLGVAALMLVRSQLKRLSKNNFMLRDALYLLRRVIAGRSRSR